MGDKQIFDCKNNSFNFDIEKMEILVQKSRSQDMLSFLYKLYQEQLLCEMDIEAGDGVTFCIHRVVLASTSSYVHHMILRNPALSKLKLEVSSKVLQLLIDFGYTGQLFVSSYLRQDVLNAATALQMNSVLDLMKKTEIAKEDTDEQVCEETDQMSTTDLAKGDTTDNMGNIEGDQIVIKTEPVDPETTEIESAMQNRGQSNYVKSSKQVREKFGRKSKNKKPQTVIKSNLPKAKRERRSSRQKSSRNRNHLKSVRDSKRRPKDWKVNLRYKLNSKKRREIYLKWLFSRFLIKKSLRHRLGTEYSVKQTGSNKKVCCNSCGKKFTRYSLFFLHLYKTHLQRSIRSWFSFPSLHLKGKLNRTSYVVAQSLKKKKLKSLSCDKELGSKTGLNTHSKKINQNTRSDNKKQKKDAMSLNIVKLQCMLCDKDVQSEAGLCKHLMMDPTKIYVDISKGKSDSSNLMQRVTTKGFKCNLCTYTTDRKANLTRHVKVHTNKDTCQPSTGTSEKYEHTDFLCDQCAKRFKSKYGLTLHKKQHEGIFKHTCKVCKKGFNQTTQFRSHFARHHGVPTSQCSFCKKGFTGHSSLQRHISICSSNPDSDIRVNPELTCKDCSQTFSSKEALAYHVKGKHGIASYVCGNCGRAFSWRSSLRAHKALCR